MRTVHVALVVVLVGLEACTLLATDRDGDPATAVDSGALVDRIVADSSADGGVSDANAETSADGGASCEGGRAPGFICGAAQCTGSQFCCDPLGAATCQTSACGTTQMNCASAADCGGMKCCRIGGNVGTGCQSTCSDTIVCASDTECPAHQRCLPPVNPNAQPWWSCRACP